MRQCVKPSLRPSDYKYIDFNLYYDNYVFQRKKPLICNFLVSWAASRQTLCVDPFSATVKQWTSHKHPKYTKYSTYDSGRIQMSISDLHGCPVKVTSKLKRYSGRKNLGNFVQCFSVIRSLNCLPDILLNVSKLWLL